jgi:hypothetical protein
VRRTDVDALIDGIAGVTLTTLSRLPARCAPRGDPATRRNIERVVFEVRTEPERMATSSSWRGRRSGARGFRARASRLCPTGKSLPLASSSNCRALPRKIFRLTRRANQRYQLARLTRQEGRLAIVTNARWDAVDEVAAADERSLSRTAKSCGPGAPVLALSSASHIAE